MMEIAVTTVSIIWSVIGLYGIYEISGDIVKDYKARNIRHP